MKKNDDEKELITRAHKRFAAAAEAENTGRIERLDDLKFVRLGEQWPDSVKRDRERPGQERPMLTINRLFQFRNQVINEIRQNKPGIKVRPVDDNADVETAEIIQGLIRHIQDASRADIAFDTAAEFMVDCGLGYVRIVTDYCDPDSFDQDIKIMRVPDVGKVYFDPASTEPDGSDATWCFVVEDWPLDEFKAAYPDIDTASWNDGTTGDRSGWMGETVRVAEYFEIETKQRELAMLIDGSTAWADEVPDPALIMRKRQSEQKMCRWYKIGGDVLLDDTYLPTQYIPVVPVLGNEIWIEGKRHLHGLTRHAKDAARQYNYMQSANTETLALAPRAPFIAAEGQIDGYENEWMNANRHNLSVLTYNPVSFGGQVMGAPQRQQPVTTNPGFEAAMQRAVDDMKASMGVYDASLGNRESNQSGKAILSQQRQASIGNFHFSDNLNRSIRHVGRIIVEMIPKIYDTARIIRILGEDDMPKNVQIDPSQQAPVTEVEDEKGEIQKIYNPGMGKYDVTVDTGPSYATKRQEAAEAMMGFVQADPAVLQVAGDLIVKNMDWPGAEEISKRLKYVLPPQITQAMQSEEAKGQGQQQIDPQIEQQMQQMADMVEHLTQELEQASKKAEGNEEKLEIERFRAQTERLKVEAEIANAAALNDAQLHQIALANMQATLSMGNSGEIEEESEEQEQEIDQQPPSEPPAQPAQQSQTEYVGL